MPKFSRRSARMLRICASTMTSSEVVGSSAIRSFGRSTRASAIMIRCRIPPENSCGYWRNRVGGMPIPPSVSSERRRIGAVVELRLVLLEGLAEVVLDAHERVQPRHRLLEDEPEVGPAEPAQLPCPRGRRGSLPPYSTSPSDTAPSGRRPDDAAAERRLPAPGLPDEPEHLAGLDLERDPVDRLHRAARRCRSRPAGRGRRRPARPLISTRLGHRLRDVDLRPASAACGARG